MLFQGLLKRTSALKEPTGPGCRVNYRGDRERKTLRTSPKKILAHSPCSLKAPFSFITKSIGTLLSKSSLRKSSNLSNTDLGTTNEPTYYFLLNLRTGTGGRRSDGRSSWESFFAWDWGNRASLKKKIAEIYSTRYQTRRRSFFFFLSVLSLYLILLF